MPVTQGGGKRIGRILGRHAVKTQNGYDHMLHLLFGRRAGSDDGLFDLSGRVLVDFDTVSERRADRRRPGMSELQGTTGVLVHKYALDRDNTGTILVDNTANGFKYLSESVCECAIDALDRSARNVSRFGAIKINDAKARQAGARIDSENATFRCQLNLDLSQHVFADIGIAVHLLDIIQIFEQLEHLDHRRCFLYGKLCIG